MPDVNGEVQLAAGLGKAIDKIEKNQGKGGTFAGNSGWASVLSQGLAGRVCCNG